MATGSWHSILLLLLLSLSACATFDERPHDVTSQPSAETEAPDAARRSFTILAVNDIYRLKGIDGGRSGGLARLRSLRTELEREHPDLLFLHAGDLLFPSLLSRSFEGAQMIDVLNYLDGDGDGFDSRMFITFGNHEFDLGKFDEASILDSRVEESQFTWLGTNVVFKSDPDGLPLIAAENLIDSTIVDSGGVRVGLFSLSTDEKHPAFVHSFLEPKAVARRAVADLRRRGAEVVVALTHLTLAEDIDLLCRLGDAGPDLAIGGHEHSKQADGRCGRWVIKADAEAVSASVVRVTLAGGEGPQVQFSYRELGPEAPAAAAVEEVADGWVARHEKEYCGSRGKPLGCLATVVGRPAERLVGEELEIRRYETNLGNWILDLALSSLREQGAQAAFLNSGSLRLNSNIPVGDVTHRHVEEIFQYPSGLRLLRVKGSVLQQVISHAVTDWAGNGRWLQISGFAFRHDPQTTTADRLTLLTADGPRPVDPDEELLVVTNDFVATPGTGQDGYTMLTAPMLVPLGGEPPNLRQLVMEAFAASRAEGISPQVEGRICNPTRPGPCLATR